MPVPGTLNVVLFLPLAVLVNRAPFTPPTVSDAGFAEVDPEVFAYRDAFAKSETHVIRSSLNYKF